MLDAAIGSEQYIILAVIIVSTMLNAGYFLPIIYKAFFGEEKPAEGTAISSNYSEAPLLMLVAMCISTLAVLLLFAWPERILALAEMVGK